MTRAQLRVRTLVRAAFWTAAATLLVVLLSVDWVQQMPLALTLIAVLWLVVIALMISERRS